jgi:hypothetical protein
MPHVFVEIYEDERRELPDRLLRAGLAEAATGKAAADGERHRDELASNQRGRAHEYTHECARVGTCNQSREERAFEGRPLCS